MLDGGEWLTSYPGHPTLQERTSLPVKWEAYHASKPSGCLGKEKTLLPLPGFKLWTIYLTA